MLERRLAPAGFVTYGFDAREPLRAAARDWTPERRDRYLLRPDVAIPLSVDRAVWPAIRVVRAIAGPTPDYWSNLADLEAACTAAGVRPDRRSLLALAVAGESSAARALTSVPVLVADRSWTVLGYDVADTGLTSALSNAGFRSSDVPALRRRWAPLLNEHGLFTTADDADEFRAFSDTRVREHAPFLVHALALADTE